MIALMIRVLSLLSYSKLQVLQAGLLVLVNKKVNSKVHTNASRKFYDGTCLDWLVETLINYSDNSYSACKSILKNDSFEARWIQNPIYLLFEYTPPRIARPSMH